MEKINSFKVNHTKFGVEMHISRMDSGATSYDLRRVVPNGGTYRA